MKNFKKQFLHLDKNRVESANGYAFRAIIPYNEMLPKLAAAIKRDITKEDMVHISKGGATFLINFYKPQFPFPNSTLEFNLQALGIDLEPLIDKMNSLNPLSYDIDINSNQVTISETQKQQFIEDYTTYTSNDKQNKALELVQIVSDVFESFSEMGFVDHYSLNNISKACKLLDNIGGKVTFNPHQIKDIKE